MSDINKLSVLEAFINNKGEILTFQSFAEKGIFKDINTGSKRLKLLNSFIQELYHDQVLVKTPPPVGWELVSRQISTSI